MDHIQLPPSQQTHKSPAHRPKGRTNWPDRPSAQYYGHYKMPNIEITFGSQGGREYATELDKSY